MRKLVLSVISIVLFSSFLISQEPGATAPPATSYTPKFAGDKARSNAEAAALGYMRTVLSAQKVYKKKHNSYAPSLSALVGSGSFTKRMVETKRGDYNVSFRPKSEGFGLALTPIRFDAEHRAFYVDESGVFRASDSAAATAASAPLD